jgi:hypothetical protein
LYLPDLLFPDLCYCFGETIQHEKSQISGVFLPMKMVTNFIPVAFIILVGLLLGGCEGGGGTSIGGPVFIPVRLEVEKPATTWQSIWTHLQLKRPFSGYIPHLEGLSRQVLMVF